MKIIKDFDLLSPKWLEIAFENKNKQYGAYELRNDSSNRHLKALIIVIVVGLFTIFLPKVVATIEWTAKPDITQQDSVRVTVFEDPEDIPEEIQQEYVEPPPILQQTIQVIQWEIGEESNTTEMMTTAEIDQTDIAIAATTVTEGSEDGVNIDELNEITNVVPEEIFVYVPVKARFPGGDAAMMKWLNENINYPMVAAEGGIQGKVFVNFIVRANGSIDGVKIQRGVHPSLDNEAMRLVKAMPRWQAGENDKGQKVHSYFTLPVTFILK